MRYAFNVSRYQEYAIDACRSTSTFHYITWVPCFLKTYSNPFFKEVFKRIDVDVDDYLEKINEVYLR
jgi:hypothetical protein